MDKSFGVANSHTFLRGADVFHLLTLPLLAAVFLELFPI
jgi:hypothetical protein